MARLRDARDTQNLTQEAVAVQAGISRTYYNHIETGRRVPSLKVALALARILGVPVESLFRDSSSATG